LMHYLDRIRRQDSGKASKAADRRQPLWGLPRPSGKGAHGMRCAAAVPRVAALLNDASERARLESATEEYAQPERKRSPKKSVVKRERDAAVEEAAAATAESTRARDALSKSKKRQAGNVERAKERAADHANERIAAQVPWRFVSAPLHVSRHFVIFLHVVWCSGVLHWGWDPHSLIFSPFPIIHISPGGTRKSQAREGHGEGRGYRA